jgi:Pyruvate/2-oxoacid:ferredoxin oxidoreductase delta subunit
MRTDSKRPVAHINQECCDRAKSCPVRQICPRDAVVPDLTGEEKQPGRLMQVLGFGSDHGWKIDEARCAGCLLCAQYCPHRAVEPRRRQPVG